jgi:hypothetical protein
MQAWPSEDTQTASCLYDCQGRSQQSYCHRITTGNSFLWGWSFLCPHRGYRAEVRSANPRLILVDRRHNPKITTRHAPGRQSAWKWPGRQTTIAILEVSPSRGLGSWRVHIMGHKYEGRRGGLVDPRLIITLTRNRG